MDFTSDWFTKNIPNFQHLQRNMGPVTSILEIGAHEGRSTCWMLENLLEPTGTITVIDPFAGTHLNAFNHDRLTDDRSIEQRFRANTSEVKKPGQTLEVQVSMSYPALAQLIVEQREYDFIYVDGNHQSDAALADAVMCFGLLKEGGMMLFDDYLWEDEPDHLDRCKASIDAFCNMFAKKIDFMLINYQLGIRKKLLTKPANIVTIPI